MVVCHYCCNQAVKVLGKVIYPHRPDLYQKTFYQCKPCNAWVGCHPNTENPLGRLANAELRKWKSMVHGLFDPIWKNKKMRRGEAYSWLAKELQIDEKECHVGMFSLERCQKSVAILIKYKSDNR